MDDNKGKISVVINTYNAQKHLDRVLKAVEGFDEVLVCDMESTDDTVEIAKRHGCRVVTFEKKGCGIVEPARQFAIDKALYGWVLVVDADEIVSDELRAYLYDFISKSENKESGLYIPRMNYFMGRFMHAYYPDYILRFFKKEVTRWPAVIHTSPIVDGVVGRIPKGMANLAFLHLANDDIATLLRKADNYSDYEVPRRKDRQYGTMALVGRPLFRFFKSYVLKGGFRDGVPGLIRAAFDGVYQFVVVAKIIEGRNNAKQPEP